MKYKNIVFIIVLSLLSVKPSFAGLGSYDKASHRLKYEVKGEMDVRPDKAVFPIVISIKDRSYAESLAQARNIISEIETALKKHDGKIFSLSSLDFYKPDDRMRKSIDLSFFGRNDDMSKTKLVSYLSVSFNDEHAFWDRSKYVAQALDFVKGFSRKYKEDDNKSIFLEEVFYEINNVEQYRESIVKSVYKKARLMADIIAKQEKLKPKIKYVSFEQHIREDVINFSKANLTINAELEYTFE